MAKDLTMAFNNGKHFPGVYYHQKSTNQPLDFKGSEI